MELSRNPDFRRLWAATAISQTGSAVTLVAMPLVAVVVLDSPPSAMGLLYAAGVLPLLLVRLPAAALADTAPPGVTVPILADVGRAAVLAILPLLWWLDALTFGVLLAVVAVIATLTGVQASFYSPLLLDVVPRDQLPAANGRLLATRSVVDVSGPGLAGLIVAVAAAPVALLVDALSFLVSATVLRGLRRGRAAAPAGEPFSLRAALPLAGSLARRPEIVAMTVVTAAGAAVTALQVLWMVDGLGIRPAVVGPLLGLGAVGGVLGGLLLTRLTRRLGERRLVVLSAALVAWSFAPLAVSRPGVGGTVAVVNYEFAGSAGGILLVGTVMTSVQAGARAGGIARTIAIALMLMQLAGVTGALGGGLLAGAVGVRAVIVAALVAVLPLPAALWRWSRRPAAADTVAVGDGPHRVTPGNTPP